MKNMKNASSSKSPLKNFLIRLAALIVIVFILDLAIGKFLNHLYFSQKTGQQYQTTFAMEKVRADILIFGASRADQDYNPSVFEKEFPGNSCYNVGREGTSLLYHYALLQSVLKRYTPKMIVLDFVDGEFMPNKDAYDRLSVLLPYYKNHPEIHSILNLRSPFEKYKLFSNIYPYNSLFFTIAAGSLKKADNGTYHKGAIINNEVYKGPQKIVDVLPSYELDSIKVNLFHAFIKECLKANVSLYISTSPMFIKSPQSEYSLLVAKDLAAQHNIRFFDFSRDTNFVKNPSFFEDIGHLNWTGATQYSILVAQEIHNTDKK